MVIVVMGPAGAGKSLVGARLAAALGWPFHEGDAFHPPDNVARMRAGTPLGDAERGPWLAALAALVAGRVAEGAPAVLTCSALRRAYRRALVPPGAPAGAVRFVYLRADAALLAARLAGRTGHFFAPALLASQLAALEPPGDGAPGDREAGPVLTLDAARRPTRWSGACARRGGSDGPPTRRATPAR
jgi:gluconokinase